MEKETKLKTISEYWDNASETFDEAHDTEDLGVWRKELEKIIGMGGAGKILDVGTGTGFLAFLLFENGYKAVGVDFAEKMLEIGKDKAAKRGADIEFIKSKCEEMPFGDNEFDALVNCRVTWTLTDPVEAIKEWMRVIKPGGKIISFMRIMKVESSHGGKESFYEGDIELPLRAAGRDKYVEVYKEAGLVDIATLEMPDEMSHADMPGWTAFVGTKKG